jgi:dihydrofolate reductase
MSKFTLDITMSLDGYVAGPEPSLEDPLGKGGEALHEWAIGSKAWRESHGYEGGTEGADSDLLAETIAAAGATIMGRKMFSGGSGPWEDDPNADAWWGDTPPFGHDVFVLTHHEREPVEKQGGTTFHFVTDGIESALNQARYAAGDKNVALGGGGDVAQQYLRAKLLDEIQIHIAPIFLGGGVRLFEGIGSDVHLEIDRVIESPAVTHLRYRVS